MRKQLHAIYRTVPERPRKRLVTEYFEEAAAMPVPVIDTILPTLEDSLIVGDPNAGKTRAAIHEMMCLLCGPLLADRPKVYGLFEMDAARVPNIVFISAETGQREIQILFNAAVAALGINRRKAMAFDQHMQDHFQVFSKEDATFRWFYPDPRVIVIH